MPSAYREIDLISLLVSNAIGRIETASIGEVTEYDIKAQDCSVKPLAKRFGGFDIKGAGNFEILDPEEQIEIHHVPVLFQSMAFGATRVCLHFPLSKGVQGLIIYCRDPIKNWIAAGGVYEPEVNEKFRLNGAVFVPGLFSDNTAMTSLMPDRVSLTVDGPVPASISIGLNDGLVRLGDETAIEPVVLGTQLQTLLNNLLTKLGTVPSCVGPGVAINPDFTTEMTSIAAAVANTLSQKVLTK